jgi:hypothetical protein
MNDVMGKLRKLSQSATSRGFGPAIAATSRTSFRNLNLGSQRSVGKRSSGEPVQCDSSFSSANLNRAAPLPPLKNSSCDKTLPTSDSHTAAVRTSSYIASLRPHGRSGNSTSAPWPGRRELETDLPKPRRKLLPEGLRVQCHDGFCEQMS